MSEDDLEKPIGKQAAPDRGKLRSRFDAPTAAAFVVGGLLAFICFWALLVDDPTGGEPVASASIERKAATALAAPAAPSDQKPADGHGAVVPREGSTVVNAGDPMPKSGPVIIRIPGPADAQGAPPAAGAIKAPEPAMLEASGYGALPRIAPDGRRPLDVYARPANPPKGAARVALVVSGLGIGRDLTTAAIQGLPSTITLAFSPYGDDVADFVEKARASGHEVLIQAPMEPFGYPQNDTGPQTLLTALPASANLERLRWTLARAKGYVGVAPLGGGKFLDADGSLQPVFTELARRGLLFAAPSTGGGDRISDSANRAGLAHTRPGEALDAVAEAGAIDAALAELERSAKQGDVVLGFASATPLALRRIDVWREGLAKRGVALVPVSAALAPQGPS